VKLWAGLLITLTPYFLPLDLPWVLLLCWLGYFMVWSEGPIPQVRWALLFALAVPLLRITTPPILADDYLRYLFDGALINQGILPYGKFPVDFPALGGLDIPKPEIATIYPPLAEGLFALSAWLNPSIVSLRLVNFMGVLIFVALCPWAFPQGSGRVQLLVATCPLVQQELLHSAHIDAWLLPFLALWHGYAHRDRVGLAGAALIGAAMIKITPFFLLLPWFWARPQHRKSIVLVGITGLLCFSPVIAELLPSLSVFYQAMDGFSPLYRVLRLWLPMDIARMVLVSFGAVLLFFAPKTKLTLFQCLGLLGGLALFFPAGFPWYLTAALPWMVHQRKLWPLGFAGGLHLLYYLENLAPLFWAAVLLTLFFFLQGIYVIFTQPANQLHQPHQPDVGKIPSGDR